MSVVQGGWGGLLIVLQIITPGLLEMLLELLLAMLLGKLRRCWDGRGAVCCDEGHRTLMEVVLWSRWFTVWLAP
jgi:hypothetical protein